MTQLPTIILVAGSLLLTACQPRVAMNPSIPQPGEVRVEAEPLVPVQPDAAKGRLVFERVCAFCHGPQGFGDGVAAKGLKAPHKNPFTDTMRLIGLSPTVQELPSRPANFHNTVQMRLNSPFSMFETVTRGRAHTAMPSFGPKPAYGANRGRPILSDEERWHVIFYEWTFATSQESIRRGREIYQKRTLMAEVAGLGRIRTTCAGCHGTDGDGRGGAFSAVMARDIWGWQLGQGPGVFTDRDFLAKRKPTELYAAIADGQGLMPGYKTQFSVDEIWSLVDYIWTFFYRYRPPRGQQAAP